MDITKSFSENKSLYTKWYKHELTGKTLPNGVGMMEKVADKAKDKHWMKLLDPYKNDKSELKYAIVVAEANFDPANWVNETVTLTEMTADEQTAAKKLVNWDV
tara:strand:- start:4370 stop:4678 length:309 start_codon:yes stop_codon:yes gene_type:complete